VLSTIKTILNIIVKVFAVYEMTVALVDMEFEDFTEDEKKEKAIEWVEDVFDDLIEHGNLPDWTKDIFFDSVFARWIVRVAFKALKKLQDVLSSQ